MPDEIDALISFHAGWVEDGVGEDGLPLYHETVRIVLAKPPHTRVEREATDDDKENFPAPWALFQKTEEAKQTGVEGYPLALWPAIGQADFKTLAARGIVTVEQLAKLAGDKVPPQIHELIVRARKMVDLQKEVGRFETVIQDLTAQRDALQAELTETKQIIAGQNAAIDQLKSKPKAA
jgi:hypothetical protein